MLPVHRNKILASQWSGSQESRAGVVTTLEAG